MANSEQVFGLPVIQPSDIESVESEHLCQSELLRLRQTNPYFYVYLRTQLELLARDDSEGMMHKTKIADFIAQCLKIVESARTRESLESEYPDSQTIVLPGSES